MHRSKRKRNIIIFSLVGVLLCMVAGYAAFQTRLEIKGTSKVTSNWNILITNVTNGTPTGSAENAVKPSWKNTSASMEANLYDKGDAMEYDVTIENQGTIDAKLNDILTNLENSNSEAVLITFSGYTKGEILKAGESKLIHVKIEYNPEYEGGETSSEVTIDFDYGQNNNEENNPDDQYLLTYDYSTNGGQSVELDKEYMLSGSNVNLDNTATKEGWTFVGWNTDKDAQIGLKEYQMPTSNTTLYAIYSKDLKVTYEKEDTVESIGKEEDACTIYNNETSCAVTLPEINVNDESATIGWYENNNKVGNPGDKYTLKNDITLIAKAEFEPIIQSWYSSSSSDFHAKEYRTNIITATFLDNKEVPSNAVASWDVSANKNGSVMAWVVADESDSKKYHLYIGGESGVIANQDSSYLFYNFTTLTEITFGDNFDTSTVTSMVSMFYNCSNLTTLDVSKWDTSKVTSMDSMFYNCSKLTTLDVSDWDTSKVTNMYYMFSSCSSLTTLDISDWDTSNVTDMGFVFSGCSSLTTLDVSKWDTSKVTSMDYMFYNCSKLTTLDVSKWNTSSVTSMNHMFSGCSSLTTLDVSKWDTSNVTDMGLVFYGCSKLTTLDVSKWDTSNVTSMLSMFNGCSKLTTLDVSDWDTSSVTSMYRMFFGCSSLTTLDVSKWDTSNVTDMDYMFYNCSKLTTLDVSKWNTSSVTSMNAMFYDCSSLTTLDVSKWDTSNVTDMDYMFYNCSKLTTLDVSKWNTSSVTSMNAMFYDCSSLTTLDVSKWNTSSVTIMASMFDGCSSLTTLDVSDWDTSKVTKMYYMFRGCRSLTKLILCSFDTNKVTNMDKMFQNTSNLKSIYVGPNWTTENATTTDMFTNCGVSSVTQSDNCEVDAMSLSLTSLSDNNSISLIANADTNVMNYSFSNDNGETWVDTNSNVYTFDDLNVNSIYNTQIRANLSNGQSKIVSKVVTTSSLEKPSFKETGNIVIITYPEGCGSTLTCTYQKDNGNIINVISSKVDIKFTKNGSIVANVSNGVNRVSSSYTVMVTENN